MKLRSIFLIGTILFITTILSGCISKIDSAKLNEKAVEYMKQGDVDAAIARLESILDLDNSYAATYYNLGIAYHQKEEYQKSIDNLNEAIKRDKSLVDAYYALGVAHRDYALTLEDVLISRKSGQNKVTNPSLLGSQHDNFKDLSDQQIKEMIVDNLELSLKNYDKYLKKAKNIEDEGSIEAEIQKIKIDLETYKSAQENQKK